jgi:ferredoxin-NADP reductase
MNDANPLGLQTPETFRAELIATRDLSSSVREFTFRREGPFLFDAGQWVNLVLPTPTHGELKRSYSIASAPGELEPGVFQLAITKVDGGPGSTYLHGLAKGATLDVIGPHGLFLHREPGPALFVGTGTGVTPLRSMFRDALRKGSTAEMVLIFGVRTEEDRLYQDELAELTARHENFNAHYTLSRARSESSTRTGYVQTHVRGLYEALRDKTGQEPHVYICGLQKMINAVRDLLRKDMGLPRQLVHSERYD